MMPACLDWAIPLILLIYALPFALVAFAVGFALGARAGEGRERARALQAGAAAEATHPDTGETTFRYVGQEKLLAENAQLRKTLGLLGEKGEG